MKIINLLLIIFLTGCGTSRTYPDYKKGETLQKDEGVLVCRVVDAHKEDNWYNKYIQPSLSIRIEGENGYWLEIPASGSIDDANSSELAVKKVKAGIYRVTGTFPRYINYNIVFYVFAGRATYLGDIVISPYQSLLVNNDIVVRRKLRQQYPELANNMIRTFAIDRLAKKVSKKK